MVYIKNDTQAVGTACYWMMSKYTDASKRLKHVASEFDAVKEKINKFEQKVTNPSSELWFQNESFFIDASNEKKDLLDRVLILEE